MRFPEEKDRDPEWYKREGWEEDISDAPTLIVRRESKKEVKPFDDLDSWCWKFDYPFW